MASGTKGSLPGPAALSSEALDPVGARGAEQQKGCCHPLGLVPGLGRVRLEQELLATPTAGRWEERAYSDQVSPSFCKEAGGLGLDSWVMGQTGSSSSSDWGAGTLVPPKRAGCGPGPAAPRQLLLLWMLLGLFAPACAPPPLITQFLGDFYYLFKLDIYCRLASAWFGGWGDPGRQKRS